MRHACSGNTRVCLVCHATAMCHATAGVSYHSKCVMLQQVCHATESVSCHRKCIMPHQACHTTASVPYHRKCVMPHQRLRCYRCQQFVSPTPGHRCIFEPRLLFSMDDSTAITKSNVHQCSRRHRRTLADLRASISRFIGEPMPIEGQ